MQVVQGGELGYEHRADKKAGRGGTGHKSRVLLNDKILGRDPSRPDNFYAGISTAQEGEFSTPRHRHNFDQWRYMIEGEADFTTAQLTTGCLGYYPEGAYYGPQDTMVGTVIIVQFGGPSGSGYVSRDEIVQAHAAMRQMNTGVFEDGLYRRNPGVEGPEVQDGYEAQWEYVRKRPLVYPKPQYPEPILIDTNAFPWMSKEGSPGVEEKFFGVFTSAKFGAARYRLEAGADLNVSERGVYVVLSGEGRVQDDHFTVFTALYLEDEEKGAFSATSQAEILYLGLPSIKRIPASAPMLEFAA